MTNLFRKQLDLHFQRSKPFRALTEAHGQDGAGLRVHGPKGAYLSLAIDRLHRASKSGASLVIVPTELEAEAIAQDVESFGASPSVLFPWWGTVGYEGTSPLASIFGQRVSTLARMPDHDMLVIAPLRAFLTPVPARGYLADHTVRVKKGQKLDPQETAARLVAAGYLRVPTVSIHGELAVRGEVMDVFIPGHELAVRLTLDFDTVVTIRRFDPINQGSTETLEKIDITPCREVILGEEEMGWLTRGLKDQGFTDEEVQTTVSRLIEDPEAGGVEMFYPLCFPSPSSLLDYLGPESRVFLVDEERLLSSAASLRKEHLELFRRARSKKRIVPGPQRVLLDLPQLLARSRHRVDFAADAAPQAINLPSDGPRSFFGNFTFFREEIEAALKNGYSVFVFAVYDVQAERLRHILKDLPVEILPQSISAGFALPEEKILAVQESEIFGRKRRIPRSIGTAKSAAIESFVELTPGDFVVHVNHGI
ncbi:MAG TPA: hypothetical protein VL354_09820, partial [Spirochaetia bacterium]|nr:hypothetical protein [Spirochaetia bacterium]